MKFDLHVHTNKSDGIYSPSEIVNLSVIRGLAGIAITDHDNIDGIEEAIKYSLNFREFKVIPGIEFSSIYNDQEVHILGYYIDYKSKKLIDITTDIKVSRLQRGKKMIKKINDLDMNITMEDVRRFSRKEFIGRPHIARALIEKRYVKSMSEAFEKYLNIDAPAYVERYKIEIDEIINLIKEIGGVSILAHPGLIKDRTIIDYCISKGINGIECIYPRHTNEDFEFLLNTAKKNNLIVTGGSDFHGDRTKDILLGEYYVSLETINQMEGI